MSPIESLKSELEKKIQLYNKADKLEDQPEAIRKIKLNLQFEITEYEMAISTLEERQGLHDNNAIQAILNALAIQTYRGIVPTRLLKFKYKYPTTERIATIKRVIKRMSFFIVETKVKSYNKLQLQTVCHRLRTELTWLKEALEL